MTIVNIDQLISQTKCYLKFVTTTTNLKGLFKLNRNEEVYILRGFYISPYGQSVLKDNKDLINGILLDVTFKILKH